MSQSLDAHLVAGQQTPLGRSIDLQSPETSDIKRRRKPKSHDAGDGDNADVQIVSRKRQLDFSESALDVRRLQIENEDLKRRLENAKLHIQRRDDALEHMARVAQGLSEQCEQIIEAALSEIEDLRRKELSYELLSQKRKRALLKAHDLLLERVQCIVTSCGRPLEEHERMFVLSCGHFAHPGCVTGLAPDSSSTYICPVCRRDVGSVLIINSLPSRATFVCDLNSDDDTSINMFTRQHVQEFQTYLARMTRSHADDDFDADDLEDIFPAQAEQ